MSISLTINRQLLKDVRNIVEGCSRVVQGPFRPLVKVFHEKPQLVSAKSRHARPRGMTTHRQLTSLGYQPDEYLLLTHQQLLKNKSPVLLPCLKYARPVPVTPVRCALTNQLTLMEQDHNGCKR